MRGRTREDNLRVAAAWVVERTLDSLAPVDAFLATAIERYDERDQGLLQELVLGTLRWLRRLDHVIETASNRKIERIEPALRAPLRLGAYQLLFLDRVPPHAAVNEAVEQALQATHRGGANFTNAVLRRIARQPDLASWEVKETDERRRLAVELSHPDILVERWIERFGVDEARRLLTVNNRPKPMQLLAFRSHGGRELLAEALIDEGLEVEPSAISPLGLTVRAGNPLKTQAFRRGEFYIQDEASQAAALLVPPRPGERVLDAAAAPGGKTFALLAWEPTVRALAADVSLPRLLRLRDNSRRLGLSPGLLLADAGQLPSNQGFDRVILDLPCTGTGTLRKHPELKWRISVSETERLASQGRRLLAGAAAVVAPGGLLLAMSCSIEEDENEGVVAAFLARHPHFELVDLEPLVPRPLGTWIQGPGFWRLPTDGDHDGFTAHVLRRK